jgi:hypothetical protein
MRGKMDRKYKNFVYDNFALGDECHRFGIIAGCKPNCPVFERGDCKNRDDVLKSFQEQNDERI